MMTDPRYRYSGGRRSPTFNPARASLPVNLQYNVNHAHYGTEAHAVPTGRWDVAGSRRGHDHKSGSTPTTTITTYSVNSVQKDLGRNSSVNRHRSSTLDSSHAPKPIIVTTNHHSKPHGSSHTSSSHRTNSPSRDPYRSSDETYYAQPASSMRSRSQHRHSHSYTPGTANDDLYRLRERVGGDERLRTPARASTDTIRQTPRPTSLYGTSALVNSPAVINYEDEGFEYTKPSDLARYDLDHTRDIRRSRRDSVDRPYYRPHVNVASNEPTARYDPRSRAKPPTSAGLERFNQRAAAGIYDRPTVTMPALPSVPAPPPMDPPRRIEGPRSPSVERRASRPRPVSLYQESTSRLPQHDDLYRPREDERSHRDHRERDETYRNDSVASRGFGVRPEMTIEGPVRPASAMMHGDYDERRARHYEREPKRRSDESMDRSRTHEKRPAEERRSYIEGSRDTRESMGRRNSISRARDKVVAGLGAAVAAVGLTAKGDDDKTSPRRQNSDEEREAAASRPVDRYKSREDVTERKSSPREDPIVVEQRREPRRERASSVSGSKDRGLDKERERETRDRERDREREKEKDYERERERERERDKEQHRRDAEARLGGKSSATRERSPPADASAGATSRKPRQATTAFNPTDTKGLMDLKAELKAMDDPPKPSNRTEKSTPRDADTVTIGTNDAPRRVESRNESRREEPRRDEVRREEPRPEERRREEVRREEPRREEVRREEPRREDERRERSSREDLRGREPTITREEREKQVRVVSPPRDKNEQKPIKGILKQPTVKFAEEEHPIREGVAPHKSDKTKKDAPPDARWTKINRKMVNPEALTIGKERFEVRDEFVIVLRVLNKDEIQAYATATAQLREMRRKEVEAKQERYSDEERNRSDEEKQRRHRHRREREGEEPRRERDHDDRSRRHRHASESDENESQPKAIEFNPASSSNYLPTHRSHRERDYESVTTASDSRR